MTPLLVMMLAVAGAADPLGFRRGGSGQWPDATYPSGALTPQYTVPTAAWGNASPVVFGRQVCFTEEPTTVRCVAAADGTPAWSADNAYVSTLSGEARTALEAKLAELPALQANLEAARQEVGRVRREIRRAGSGITAADLTAASKELDRLGDALAELQPYLTPDDKGVIGYTSPTPVTDGSHLFALTGNGVLAAYDAKGTRLWAEWLGTAQTMRGYDHGTTASPLLVDGVLLAAHGHLQARDPATGALRWKDDTPWREYGTPGIAWVQGRAYALTGDGRVLRVRDGEQVASGLSEIWFSGPMGAGATAYWVGGRGRADDPNNAHSSAFELVASANGIEAKRLWHHTFPVPARIYMAPVLHDGRLHTVTTEFEVVTLAASDGRTLSVVDLKSKTPGTPFQGVMLVGDQLVIPDDRGGIAVLTTGDTPSLLRVDELGEENRSTPAFGLGHMYVRPLSGLEAFRTP